MIESQNPNFTGRVGRPVLWWSASITPKLNPRHVQEALSECRSRQTRKASKQRHSVASDAKRDH
jgi:hypothetical protein